MNRKTFDAGVSDATSPTMPNTMSKPENEELALSATTANRRSLIGKNKSAARSKEFSVFCGKMNRK